jgi:hypothetical protein
MVIDIITYTDEQFAVMSPEQIMEIKDAQFKKNKLTLALEEKLQKEKERLSENGILRSELWGLIQEKLYEQYDAEVENLREGLLFYLRFSSISGGGGSEEEAPYVVNYALSETERFNIVKTYYETHYTSATERFNAFEKDKIAPKYLGELYAALYDYFLEDV